MASDATTPAEMSELIEAFYFRLEEFDYDCYAMETMARTLAEETEIAIRRNWETKRRRYEANLAKSADHLIEVTSLLRLMAQRLAVAVPSLDALGLSLVYRPQHSYPKAYPPESLMIAACDDCNRVMGVLRLSSQPVRPTQSEPIEPLSHRQMEIMAAALELEATSSHTRVTAERIVSRAIPQGDWNSHKVPFQVLVQRGYLESVGGRGGGYFLTAKGIAEAERIAKVGKSDARPAGA